MSPVLGYAKALWERCPVNLELDPDYSILLSIHFYPLAFTSRFWGGGSGLFSFYLRQPLCPTPCPFLCDLLPTALSSHASPVTRPQRFKVSDELETSSHWLLEPIVKCLKRNCRTSWVRWRISSSMCVHRRKLDKSTIAPFIQERELKKTEISQERRNQVSSISHNSAPAGQLQIASGARERGPGSGNTIRGWIGSAQIVAGATQRPEARIGRYPPEKTTALPHPCLVSCAGPRECRGTWPGF